MSTIIFLVKFFEKEHYASDFVGGKMYSNTLGYAKKREDEDRSGRADRDEGTTAWLQPGQVDLKLSGIDLSDALAEPLQIQMNWLDGLHIYCMSAGHTGSLDKTNLSTLDIEYLRQKLLIPEDCLDLGEFAVVIHNVTEFFRRMDVAVKANNWPYARGLVGYYNPATFHGDFHGIEAAFRKQNQFDHQREYRFVFDVGSTGNAHLEFEIGDISDITLRVNSSQLRSDDYLRLSLVRRG